jgi:hypothetical protein
VWLKILRGTTKFVSSNINTYIEAFQFLSCNQMLCRPTPNLCFV